MSYLFLSYAKADKEAAKSIKSLLEKTGYVVWMDENPRELSEQEWPIIEENIRNAMAFVLLVSDASKESTWIRRELDYAERLFKSIFPILIEGEGWSHLKMEVLSLEQGHTLAIPETFRERLARLHQTASSKPLPPQISKILEDKQAKDKQKVYRWLGLIAAMILILILSALFFPKIANNIARFQHQAQTQEMGRQRLQMVQATSNAALLTRTQYRVEASQERATLNVQHTEDRLSTQAIATEQGMERAATLTEAAHIQETLSVPTQTAQYYLERTAIIMNVHLPCYGSLKNGESELQLYRTPNRDGNPSRSSYEGDLILEEWYGNEDGFWYLVGTDTRASIGYVLAEDLELDESCPR